MKDGKLVSKDTGFITIGVSVEPEYAMNISDERMKEPCLMVVINLPNTPNVPIIIDGNHRLFKAYFTDIKELPAYEIKDKDAIKLFLKSPIKLR